ncbi:MAG: calcium/proton exchanger [Pseudomonadota bacterium]|jgi:Ca2+:H+ antiporter
MTLNWLLALIPVSVALNWYHADPILVFLCSALSIVPLAGLMEKATDAISDYLGPTYGGLLNATMGNAPELIIGISALRNGLIDILKASIAGSIMGTLLFGMGLSLIAGGLRKPRQSFDSEMVSVNGALLMLGTFGLVIPAVFKFGAKPDQEISLEISIVLFMVYLASMVFTLITRRPAVGAGAVRAELAEKGESANKDEKPAWSSKTAFWILGGVAVVLAVVSDALTDSIDEAADAIGLTPVFAGVFLLSIVGNVAQFMNSTAFAYRNQMTLALSVNLGATTQLVLLVAPVLVIAGNLMGMSMDLLFTQFELVGIILSVMVARNLLADHTSTWLEGVMLIGVYMMLGIGFFYAPSP